MVKVKLHELPDKNWSSFERKRFKKDSTKAKTESFDPESFKHDGFEDREKYLDVYVPGLADEERLAVELNDFTPPRLRDINDSPYQALVIRYGILRKLIQQLDYSMEKQSLLESVQSWQEHLIESFEEDDFSNEDDLLHLGKAAVGYKGDIDDSELHLLYSYFETRNRAMERKHEYYTWLDLFKRLASIDRFPKVTRSERPAHALDTIEKGLWSLQEQAIVYEIVDPDQGDIVGIPEEFVEFVRDWLYYEMADENYLKMLDQLEPFDSQENLVEARRAFGVETPTSGLNEKRRESLVKAGIFPSELLREVLEKDEMKGIVDRYGLNAHKRKTDQMIEKIIEYFEQSQKYPESDEVGVELYLSCFEDIADGNVERIPPQLQGTVLDENETKKLEILFEEATAEIFEEIFNLSNTTLKGQNSTGIVPDGEIEQDGKWLLWDNKRRMGKFKLGSDSQAKIRNYIDRKSQQHDVEWFLIIAPDFTSTAAKNANKLEMQAGVDIRLIRARDFAEMSRYWRDQYSENGTELPLSIFNGSDILDVELVTESIESQFS